MEKLPLKLAIECISKWKQSCYSMPIFMRHLISLFLNLNNKGEHHPLKKMCLHICPLASSPSKNVKQMVLLHVRRYGLENIVSLIMGDNLILKDPVPSSFEAKADLTRKSFLLEMSMVLPAR